MARNLARASRQKTIGVKDAKAKVLELIEQGYQVEQAMSVVDRGKEAYRSWMKADPEFKAEVNRIREAHAETAATGREPVPDFETFCRDWLKQPLFPHQLRMLDIIEGREPRDLHPSMDFMPGYDNRIVVNVPPEHAKSTTFSVNYVVWRIHQNPDIRVAIIS